MVLYKMDFLNKACCMVKAKSNIPMAAGLKVNLSVDHRMVVVRLWMSILRKLHT